MEAVQLLVRAWCNPRGGVLQRLLADMEGLKGQVQAVQRCQSALQVPEDVMPSLAICHTALRLQHEASQLQHVAIQQCNILQVRGGHMTGAEMVLESLLLISHVSGSNQRMGVQTYCLLPWEH